MSARAQTTGALWLARVATTNRIIEDVADEYGLTVEALRARSRISPLPEARREVMARLWERGLTTAEIGRLVGRDHCTVIYSLKLSFGDDYAKLSPGKGRTRKTFETTKITDEAAE